MEPTPDEIKPKTHSKSDGLSDDVKVSDDSERRSLLLPYSRWWPLLTGALIGLTLRLVFSGKPGGPFAAMQGVFIFFAPMAVGAITVYFAERKMRRGWGYYVWAPAVASALCVIGSMLILIEGLICAIIIVPLFMILGATGGLIMGVICRATNWPKHAAYSFVILPLALGGFPTHEADYPVIGVIERSITVPASPKIIWRQIQNARDIRPDEVGGAWIYRIGVPLPIAGVTEQTSSGLVRKITMGKSVHFDQVVADWDEARYVRWTYRFYADSFPPGALDDHVKIGGHYFDVIDTAYTLTPVSGRSTLLNVKMKYRVSTQFNWYADGVAHLLIGNFEEVILEFYRDRAVNASSG
jgi:hypothetical protein